MAFLTDHYKGKYRLLAQYDIKTNQFPRKLNGSFEDIDMYIACQKNIKIFYYGKSLLEVYIPSKQRGRNIIKNVQDELGNDIIFNIEETDSEVLFKFHSKNMDKLEKYLRPKTSGANISPFSTRNLPQNKTYKIPCEELEAYKEIIKNIPQNRILELTHRTNNFIKNLVTKKVSWENIKSDMALKGLKGKEYIHSIGEWDKYIDYLKHNT